MVPALKKLLGNDFVQALASPMSVDDYLALVDPTWSVSEPRGRVVRVTHQTADAVTLVIKPNSNWAGHRAGQHVLLGVEIEGVRHSRCFSLSSPPEDSQLEVTIKRNGEGRVSNYLVDHAAIDMVVYLSAPQGEFYCDSNAPAKALLLSAGSGITPVAGLVKHWAAQGTLQDVVFLHYARSRDELIFADELSALADATPGLTVMFSFTGESPEPMANGGNDVGGRISASHLDRLVDGLSTRETWLCGPEGFMQAAETLISERSDKPLHREHFAATRRVSATGEGTVFFNRSGTQAETNDGSLLEVAEKSGLTPAYGCRMGICQTCQCRVEHGTVPDLRNNEVRDVRDSRIQLCSHAAAGDVELEL